MKFETKFELGQSVWFIDYQCPDHNMIEYYVGSGTVVQINTESIKNTLGQSRTDIEYKVVPANQRGQKIWLDVDEERMFTSEEEAIKLCAGWNGRTEE